MQSRLLYCRNPLAYPAGFAPGFDPNHVALRGTPPLVNVYSLVMVGTGPFNPIGKPTYTISGAPTKTINGYVGPGASFSGTQLFTPANPNFTPTEFTAAAIFFTGSVAGDQGLVEPSNNAMYLSIGVLSAFPGTVVSSGITLAANTPYFVAASWRSGSGLNFIVANLATGVTQSAAIAPTGTGGVVNTVAIGNSPAGTQPFLGVLSTAMWCPRFLSAPELSLWAQDPWAFWYPRLAMPTLFATNVVIGNFATFAISQDDGRTITQMVGY